MSGAFRLKSATGIIALVTAAVSLMVFALANPDTIALSAGFIPARFSGLLHLTPAVPAALSPFSAALLHGSFLHLALNLLMLAFVGSQVERVLGPAPTVALYLFGALVAALAQWAVDPASAIPMVGASGAISALFGTYALLAARPRQVFNSARANRALHAGWLLAAWIVIQWMTAALAGGEGMLLATPAHIGGFIAGLVLQRPLLLWRYREA